uniref:Ribosomal protein n=1 Tax=Pristionchus pacificus TaxID=54126 RepID=A0A2A6BCC5_PRIPA|eukprot:PDM63539.1 ribosomal protein [Pristionchus pacificus]
MPQKKAKKDQYEWEVEKVIDRRLEPDGSFRYLTKWKNCPSSENSWEPRSSFGSDAWKVEELEKILAGEVKKPKWRINFEKSLKAANEKPVKAPEKTKRGRPSKTTPPKSPAVVKSTPVASPAFHLLVRQSIPAPVVAPRRQTQNGDGLDTVAATTPRKSSRNSAGTAGVCTMCPHHGTSSDGPMTSGAAARPDSGTNVIDPHLTHRQSIPLPSQGLQIAIASGRGEVVVAPIGQVSPKPHHRPVSRRTGEETEHREELLRGIEGGEDMGLLEESPSSPEVNGRTMEDQEMEKIELDEATLSMSSLQTPSASSNEPSLNGFIESQLVPTVRVGIQKLIFLNFFSSSTQLGDEWAVNEAVCFAPAFELESDLPEVKLFGKWNLQEVNVADISLVDYITVKEKYAKEKTPCRCSSTPLSCRPREDSTRIGRAGAVRRQSVDVAPFRLVNQAMWLLGTGAHEAAFRNIKTIAECLADELINAAKESPNNYAIKKKDESDRVAHCFAPCLGATSVGSLLIDYLEAALLSVKNICVQRMFSHGYLIWFAVVDVQIPVMTYQPSPSITNGPSTSGITQPRRVDPTMITFPTMVRKPPMNSIRKIHSTPKAVVLPAAMDSEDEEERGLKASGQRVALTKVSFDGYPKSVLSLDTGSHSAFFNTECAVGPNCYRSLFSALPKQIEGLRLTQLWQSVLIRLVESSREQKALMEAVIDRQGESKQYPSVTATFAWGGCSRTIFLAPPSDLQEANNNISAILAKVGMCSNAIRFGTRMSCSRCVQD